VARAAADIPAVDRAVTAAIEAVEPTGGVAAVGEIGTCRRERGDPAGTCDV